jgi:hypothetical protein
LDYSRGLLHNLPAEKMHCKIFDFRGASSLKNTAANPISCLLNEILGLAIDNSCSGSASSTLAASACTPCQFCHPHPRSIDLPIEARAASLPESALSMQHLGFSPLYLEERHW